MADPLDFLADLTGKRLPGGCDDCDAYHRVHRVEPSLWSVTVHHDDTCPTYQRHKGHQ